ncbi:MAG: class I SAM-dependent methyltransferase [Methanobacteriaceae archaeon]|nr:class I SAM-dependent methyltransferase [Methanobacteriaceae archaeon]
MKCKCKNNCISYNTKNIEDIRKRFKKCSECSSINLKKHIPLKEQIDLNLIDENYYKCKCNKRHLDIVMAHILKIMISENEIKDNSSLRNIGTPLITPAIPIELQDIPYLIENSLTIITPKISSKTAEKIVNKIPEVKGVIEGDTRKTVGQLDTGTEINTYDLKAGCDIRCDILIAPKGLLYIYKPQTQVHIEYPKIPAPKIMQLDEKLEKLDNPKVLDCTCGPGTLGIYALLSGAKHVTFNDINLITRNITKTNIKINLPSIERERYSLYNMDILTLAKTTFQKFDLAILDTFPGIKTDKYEKALLRRSKEVLII